MLSIGYCLSVIVNSIKYAALFERRGMRGRARIAGCALKAGGVREHCDLCARRTQVAAVDEKVALAEDDV